MRINRVQACLHNFLSYVIHVCLICAERASRGSDERKRLKYSVAFILSFPPVSNKKTYQFYCAVFVSLRTILVCGKITTYYIVNFLVAESKTVKTRKFSLLKERKLLRSDRLPVTSG